MKKTISLFVFALMLMTSALTGCDATVVQEESTGAEQKYISIIDKSMPFTQGNLITKSSTDDEGNVSVNYFNDDGNMVESYLWSKSEEFLSHTIMTYDENNNIISTQDFASDGQMQAAETYSYDEDGAIESKTVKEYKNGRLVKDTKYDNNEKVIGYTVNHHKDDLLTKVERFDANGGLEEYFVYEYNDKNQSVKYSSFDQNGKLKRFTTFEYDENKLVKESYFDGDSKLSKYFTFDYYDSGAKKASFTYDSNSKLISSEYFEEQ